ncbi:MAG: hypothetical protein AAFU80_06805 [Pseudomonadota bacterium]
MVAKISGIDFALDKIKEIDSESPRSIRIAHVDYSWDLSSPAITGVLNFFDDSDRNTIQTRNLATTANYDLQARHGSACSAILRTSAAINLTGSEQHVWNLAPHATVYAVPLALPEAKFPSGGIKKLWSAIKDGSEFESEHLKETWEEFERDWDEGYLSAYQCAPKDTEDEEGTTEEGAKLLGLLEDFIDYQNFRLTVNATFDRLIELCEKGELSKGDLIVCPINAKSIECCPETATLRNFDFPILQYGSVREKIAKITCDYEVSVIVAAGNSGLDLSHGKLPLFFGTKAIQETYKNRGLACGAVLVGADNKHSTRNSMRMVNKGKCIDSSGRYELHEAEAFQSALSVLADHWSLSSGASMVVAACLANIQHYRHHIGAGVLKPYEARAHIRQWAAMDPNKSIGMVNRKGYMGSPPDLEAWMKGTRIA